VLVSELELAADVGRHLDDVGAVWCVGGSVASSLLGIPRATLDVDLVADLALRHVDSLCNALVSDYYVDADTCRWAVTERRSFNAIHLASMIKIDVFCAPHDSLARSELARRTMLRVGERDIPVCSPEDIILQKLLWYVSSGGSERQWSDAAGVVTVRGDSLERAYLDHHARERQLVPLLDRLLAGELPPKLSG
jgi:hypothetical protein